MAAVVSLPLALAFGVSSGAGPMAGLYSAIFVGFFAALFGGTPCQVSGPTGPMTVVMAAVLSQFAHEPAMAFTVVVLGGLLQVGIGAAKMGRFINFVPFSVVSGFMTGIGCIVIILQIPPFIGYGIENAGILDALGHFPHLIERIHLPDLALGALTLALVLLWPRSWGRVVPGAIVALVVATVVAGAGWLGPVAVIGPIPSGLPSFQGLSLEFSAIPHMIHGAVILALLGSIDSLLTSLIADTVTRTHHDSNRELVGQGIGNAISGLFGGIPGAGSTMLTLGNARSGGRTPLAGMIHSLIILAVVLGFGGLFELVPHAALAGILLKLGLDIIDWNYLRRLVRVPGPEAGVTLTVVFMTIFVDLITAVAVGIIMVSLLHSRYMLEHELDRLQLVRNQRREDMPLDIPSPLARHIEGSEGDIALLRFHGPFSFASAKELVQRFSKLEFPEVLILDFAEVHRFDVSAAMAIEEVLQGAAAAEVRVIVCGLYSPGGQYLTQLKVFDAVAALERYADLEAVAGGLSAASLSPQRALAQETG